MPRSINTNQLTAGKTFMVRGNITYCRIASQIAGDELAKSDARIQQKGWNPVGRPHTTVTICNARVECVNPNQPSLEEQYGMESMFTSQSEIARDNGGGYCFQGMNKGKFLPFVGVRRQNEPNTVDEIVPENELATGLDVTLVMRVFQGKPNKGVSLDGVIVNEPLRYRTNNATASALADLGITFNPAPNKPVPVEANPIPNTTQTAPMSNDTPFGGAPAHPVTPPPANGNPFASAPNPNYGAPNSGNQGGGQAAPAMNQNVQQGAPVTPNTAPMNTPQAPNYQGGENNGIRYRPEDNRNY